MSFNKPVRCMRYTSLSWLTVIIMVLISFSIHAQDIIFNKVQPPFGGFPGTIFSVTQDKFGYIWFGSTNGLFRYDGYRFRTYVNNPADSNSIGANYIENVYADSKGFIWIITWTSGLDRLDPVTGKVTHFRAGSRNGESISDNLVRAIHEDREGDIWIGTLNGLDRYNPQTGKFMHYKHNPANPKSISCNRVRALEVDNQGRIWVGTGSPWPGEGAETEEGGLNLFDKKTETFTRFTSNPADAASLINNKVNAIFEDSKGNFWVGTAGDGLHTMDRSTGKFTRHRYDPAHPEKLSRSRVNPKAGVDYITFINEDKLQQIWIGTFAGGLIRYNPETHLTLRFGKETTRSEFPETSAFSYLNSADGNIWIASFTGGIYRLDRFRKKILEVDLGVRVNAISSDTAQFWLGTGNGLLLKNKRTGSVKRYTRDERDSGSISGNTVLTIHKDSRGTFWIGTDNGLNRFNPEKNNFTRYGTGPGPGINTGTKLTIADAGPDSLWLGTSSGLALMNKRTGQFRYLNNGSNESSITISNLFTHLLSEKSGDLWITFMGGEGIGFFDHESKKISYFLKGIWVNSLLKHRSGSVWVGASDGLYYLSDRRHGFIRFTASGSSIKFGNVYSILEDNLGKIWLVSSTGFYRVDIADSSVLSYTGTVGLDPNILIGGVCHSEADGVLFFGTNSGYYQFFPEDLISNTSVPEILLTGFSIRGKPGLPGGKFSEDSAVERISSITLSHNQNVFSFEFAGIHYSAPEFNQHLYMLENYDQGWHEAGEDKTAEYFNVPPGHYVFHIKASSSNGIWAEKSIDVTISPPWWRTWWAYGIFTATLLLLAFRLYNFQKARLLKAEREKARERELVHARDIEKAYQELKVTQAQLIQFEKMASLGELTAGIAHEIQNPLNFVNNFSEVNKELAEELVNESVKGNITEVQLLAKDILDNEEKISHHGKRADAIVKSMLQHSRSSSSGQKEPTDINALCDEYLRLAYHGFRSKDKNFNATLVTQFDESIGKVNIVPQEIGRVLLNLYNNSFYALSAKATANADLPAEVSVKSNASPTAASTKAWSPTLTVKTSKQKHHIQISVADNGPGIPEKFRDKIFQPFFTSKPTGQGTGLGLSLAYDILTKGHGGELRVNSKPGEGAEFVIILPVNS